MQNFTSNNMQQKPKKELTKQEKIRLEKQQKAKLFLKNNAQSYMSIIIIPIFFLIETGYCIFILVENYKQEQYVYFGILLGILIIERLANLVVVNWYFVEVHEIQECWLIMLYCFFLNFTYLDTLVIAYNAMKYEDRQLIPSDYYEKSSDTVILEHKSINNGLFRSILVSFLLMNQTFIQNYEDPNAIQTSRNHLVPCIFFNIIAFSFANMDYFYVHCTYGLIRLRKKFNNWEKAFYFFVSYTEVLAKIIPWALLARMSDQNSLWILALVEIFFSFIITLWLEKNFLNPSIYIFNIIRNLFYFRAEPFINSPFYQIPQEKATQLKKFFGTPSRIWIYFRGMENIIITLIMQLLFEDLEKEKPSFKYLYYIEYVALSLQIAIIIAEELIYRFNCITYDWRHKQYICCDISQIEDEEDMNNSQENQDNNNKQKDNINTIKNKNKTNKNEQKQQQNGMIVIEDIQTNNIQSNENEKQNNNNINTNRITKK